MQLSYTGNPNTAGKRDKPKSLCMNKNAIEIIKWLFDSNCNDNDSYVSLPLAKFRNGFMHTAKNCLGTPLLFIKFTALFGHVSFNRAGHTVQHRTRQFQNPAKARRNHVKEWLRNSIYMIVRIKETVVIHDCCSGTILILYYIPCSFYQSVRPRLHE